MLIKPIIERLKRILFFTIVVFLISMLFNLRTHDGFSIARIGLVHYWILTIALALALLLFAFWIAYTAYCFRKIALDKLILDDGRVIDMKLKIVAYKDRCYYYLMAILPCLIIYIFVIFVMSYFRPAGMTMFYAYLYHYMPYIAAILFIFSYLMLKAIDSCPFRLFNYAKPLTIEVVKRVEVIKEVAIIKKVEVVKEKLVVPAHVLDEHIDFYELFPVLYCIAGIGPIRDAQGRFRFFDIAMIYSTGRTKYLILVDGTVTQCNMIFTILKRFGLMQWMVKISGNYYVNMMLVKYPIVKENDAMQFQPEVVEKMLTNLKKADILLKLKPGNHVNGKHVKIFLDSRNSLEHKGWDTFIPMK